MSTNFDNADSDADSANAEAADGNGDSLLETRAPDLRLVQSSARRLSASTIAWGVALGALLGVGLTVGGFAYFYRGTAEVLTLEALQAAELRWKQDGPPSYNQDLELVGSQAGTIQVEVRDGQVTRMIRNGYQPSQQRTWSYWSVPGQFETIEVDWEAAKHPEQGFGVAPGVQAVLRAEFDQRYGYPRFYQRILMGTGIHVEWRVTRFEVVGK